MIVVSQMAQEHTAEVAGAEMADEFEVAEVEMAVGRESSSGSDGGPVRVGAVVGAEVEGGGSGGETRFIEAKC